jgi:hypothetical protein
MEYKLEDIETFLAVVEAGGVSAGALRLNLAKSVVSERLKRLERALGATLLHRSAQGVVPTDRGVDFYQRSRAVLEQLDAAAESVTEEEGALAGLLRIAAPMSFGARWLGPALCPSRSTSTTAGSTCWPAATTSASAPRASSMRASSRSGLPARACWFAQARTTSPNMARSKRSMSCPATRRSATRCCRPIGSGNLSRCARAPSRARWMPAAES